MLLAFDPHQAEVAVLFQLNKVIEAMRQGNNMQATIDAFSAELRRREYPESYINGALQYARKKATQM